MPWAVPETVSPGKLMFDGVSLVKTTSERDAQFYAEGVPGRQVHIDHLHGGELFQHAARTETAVADERLVALGELGAQPVEDGTAPLARIYQPCTKQELTAVSAGLSDGAQQGAISKGAQRGPICGSLRNRGSVPGGGDALALAIRLCLLPFLIGKGPEALAQRDRRVGILKTLFREVLPRPLDRLTHHNLDAFRALRWPFFTNTVRAARSRDGGPAHRSARQTSVRPRST